MIQNDIADIRKALNYSTVLKQMKTFIDQYNASQSDKKLRLNSNITATAEKITTIYLKQLHKAISLGDRFNQGLPGFRTYNRSLATYRNCTAKTIMNHKKRLKIAGFITEEINHGGSGVELIINESILSLKPLVNQSVSFLKTENPAPSFISPLGKNLRTLVHEKKELLNINSNVDNSDVIKGVSHTANESLVIFDSGTPQEDCKNTVESDNIKNSSATKKIETSRENFENTVGSDEETTGIATTNGNAVDSSQPIEENKKNNNKERALNFFKKEIPVYKKPKVPVFDTQYKKNLVVDFWFYVKAILYPDLSFTDAQEVKIKNLIWTSLYKTLKTDLTIKQVCNYQDEIHKRVDMVANWRARNPKHRWIPLPEIYFNANNKRNGFDKTQQWLINAKKSKQYVYLKLETERKTQKVLDQIDKEWSDYENSIGKHTDKTRIQLFQIQQKRIALMNDPKLSELFQDVLHQNLTKKRIYATS